MLPPHRRSSPLARRLHDRAKAVSGQLRLDGEQGEEGRPLQLRPLRRRPTDELRRQQGQERQVRDKESRRGGHAAGARFGQAALLGGHRHFSYFTG